MGDGKQGDWSGIGYLRQLNGLSAEASPVRATFLAHRVGASGRLWMTQGVNIRSIDFVAGQIAGISGYTSLLDGVDGLRHWSLDEWVQAQAGGSESEALHAIGLALCKQVLLVEDAGDWMVNFVEAQDAAEADSVKAIDALRALNQAIAESVSTDEVRQWLESVAATGVEAWAPDDSPPERWGLDDNEKRLLEVAGKQGSVGALFVEVGRDGWTSLAKLWRLGWIQNRSEEASTSGESEAAPASPVVESETPIAQASPPPVTPEPPASPPKATQNPRRKRPQASAASSGRTRTSASAESETKRAARKGESGGQRVRKKRRRDPRLVAIMRAPYENPASMEAELREAYDLLQRLRPEVIFRLKKSQDLDSEKIERRYLDACSRYHPDRYRGATQGVQVLAEGCFTAVSDAFHRLKDEEYAAELRIRLIEKETGKRVVTDKTRSSAKVEFAKAEVLFKQKRYEEALELAKRAAEGDPDRWQYEFLKLRASYRTGEASVDDIRNIVGSMSGMNSMEKGNALYTVGEMYMRDGNEKKAFDLFRQTLSLDEQNVGARRRLRLKGRREQEANEKETTGIFGGLFQRRKR